MKFKFNEQFYSKISIFRKMDFNLFLKARFFTVIQESFKTLFETVIQMSINDFYRINEQFFLTYSIYKSFFWAKSKIKRRLPKKPAELVLNMLATINFSNSSI